MHFLSGIDRSKHTGPPLSAQHVTPHQSCRCHLCGCVSSCLAEAPFQLPDDWKQRGVLEKYVLKQAVRDLLPTSILQRPKSGMLVPVHYWLRGELRKFAAETLFDRHARTQPILNRAALLQLLNFRGGGVPGFYGDRIWLLLSLEFWMQCHDIRA